MKTVLVVLDGASDRACRELQGKTPLEAASTPNLDFFAKGGKQGYSYLVGEHVTPESNEGIFAILGYDPKVIARGTIEAIGSDIKLGYGDLALRTNFATMTNLKEGKIIDRRAGRNLTNREAAILAKAINKHVKLPYKFVFKPTIQHRGVLVIRGGFSDNITDTDIAGYKTKKSDELHYSTPLDDDETAELSSNIVNDFVEHSYFILKNHPVNKEREKRKMLPANIILTRDAGAEFKGIDKLPGKWVAVVSMPLEKGIAKLTGMQIYSVAYPELKNYDVYSNLYASLSATIAHARKCIIKTIGKYDYFYVHFKETDLPGHDNKPEEKKKMLEILDTEFFAFLKNLAEKEKFKIVVTADHATPCNIKMHCSDAVPVLIFGSDKDATKRFTEKESRGGSLGKINSKNIIKGILS
ncbi:2,3-bisphosphoglycerate-independent phosphoglycerate mutase [Candidatus Pacearchaeota archaeon]|nr:2,3-bisphosphoglycerate-independent phosphoglycerate mutase [Candidatus Pacearchaeota archaeon]